MNDMDDFVDVRVTQRGHEISVQRYKLPVTIGRLQLNTICIGHDPEDKSISRKHASIQRSGDRLQLVDSSNNGTIYRGHKIKGEVVDIDSTDSFEIVGFKISVSKAKHDPSFRVIFEAHVLVDGIMKGKPFLIGEMMLVCFKTNKGYRFDQIPVKSDVKSFLLSHRLDAEYPFAGVISIKGVGRLFVDPSEDRPDVAINHRPVTESAVDLSPRDVVEIGNIRIELYPPGEKSLKCSNPSCELLNPYDLNANCRFCSFSLVGGLTRLVSATNKPKAPGT